MDDPENYFIKPGYRANPRCNSYDAVKDAAYWTPERIELGATYQFDVYVAATACMTADGRRSLLDVGSGPPQKLSRLLADKPFQVCLVDQPSTAPLATRMLPRARFVAADLEVIDQELGMRFDVIVCADVIEHLVDPDPCLAFIRRHLAEDGLLFISTPERDVLRGRDCLESPHAMHVREWNRAEFRRLLESRSFVVERHLLLPQQRLPRWRHLLGRLRCALGLPPVWFSCQMAVCRVS